MVKRIIKWFFLAVLAVALTVASVVFGIYAYARSIVHATPGRMPVPVAPGLLGEEVNVFSATGGWPWMCGHDTPAACVPFGMVRLGPDTRTLLVDQTGVNRSGYYYNDNKLIGFSHTRLVGADAQEGGVFRIFPTVPSRLEKAMGKDRFTRFSHDKETAFPGYYAVLLPKEQILAELTATTRAGVHRYTFKNGEAPHLLLDATSCIGDKRVENGVLSINPGKSEVEGSARLYGSFSGRYDGLDVYFAARFSRPFASFATWNGGKWSAAPSAAGNDIGADLSFAPDGKETTVEVRLAISYVSLGNARLNLEAEAAGKSFEDVYAAARDAWEQRLSAIRVQGGTKERRRVFHTALYRAFQMPTIFTDVNGEYIGFDRAVRKAEGFTYYTDFSLWDTFRTVHPLYSLIARKEHRDMMMSLVEMAKAGGAFPRWPSGCGYTNCMFGTPADIAVTEAWLKGVRGFDIQTAYQSMRQVAMTGPPEGCRFGGRGGLEHYLRSEYCPTDKMNKSVSATLEYTYADHSLSLLAKELGFNDDAALFDRRSRWYRNTWNPATQFFQPRDTAGNFSTAFDPLILSYVDFDQKFTKDFVEGSAMQWRWSVPFDPEGLVGLFKNPDFFVSELENYMKNATPTVGEWNPGPHYWHGNEPYIHAPYLFNAAGRPDLTQKWVRWILDTKYKDTYYGLDGNNDGGTLSSWYVFSALGFYPLAGSARYELGAPLFEKADVLIDGKTLTIEAANYGDNNALAASVSLNGAPLAATHFTHDQIAGGGILRFDMSPAPRP